MGRQRNNSQMKGKEEVSERILTEKEAGRRHKNGKGWEEEGMKNTLDEAEDRISELEDKVKKKTPRKSKKRKRGSQRMKRD